MREDTGERVVALCGTGGYAEYATAPRGTHVPDPRRGRRHAALALTLQGLTAWHLFRTSARLAEGESVVVHAAAGGVGSLAVQLAHPMGAGRVIATASSQPKRDLALELGADVAIDTAPEGLAERIEQANGARKVDIVLEMAGGEVFEQSLAALAPFGRMVAYGIASRQQNQVRTGSLMRRSQAVVGFWLNHCLGRPEMVGARAGRPVRAPAARRAARRSPALIYPLEQAAQAQIDLQERRTTGKVVLDVTGDTAPGAPGP